MQNLLLKCKITYRPPQIQALLLQSQIYSSVPRLIYSANRIRVNQKILLYHPLERPSYFPFILYHCNLAAPSDFIIKSYIISVSIVCPIMTIFPTRSSTTNWNYKKNLIQLYVPRKIKIKKMTWQFYTDVIGFATLKSISVVIKEILK